MVTAYIEFDEEFEFEPIDPRELQRLRDIEARDARARYMKNAWGF